jgi:hypothetical protein
MDILRVAGEVVTAMLLLFTSTAWPPAATGAFWAMVGFWGVVSVLFDDETPRGIPGLDVIYAYRAAAEKNPNPPQKQQ